MRQANKKNWEEFLNDKDKKYQWNQQKFWRTVKRLKEKLGKRGRWYVAEKTWEESN